MRVSFKLINYGCECVEVHRRFLLILSIAKKKVFLFVLYLGVCY